MLGMAQGGEMGRRWRQMGLAWLVVVMGTVGTVDGTLCYSSQNSSKNTLNCVYTFSYTCDSNPLSYTFINCEYDNCTSFNSSSSACTVPLRSNSSDFSYCNNQCNVSNSSASENQWTSILLIILSIILLFVICYCIVRRCRNDPREQDRMRPPSERNLDFQLATHRHMNGQAFDEARLEWKECADSAKWTIQEQTCAICLDKGLNAMLPCNHYFHSQCIRQWLSLKKFCPICKAEHFSQLKLQCKTCKAKELLLPVLLFTKSQIPDHCPSCP